MKGESEKGKWEMEKVGKVGKEEVVWIFSMNFWGIIEVCKEELMKL